MVKNPRDLKDDELLRSWGKQLKIVQQELSDVGISNYEVWTIYLKLIRNINVNWKKYDLGEYESTIILSEKHIKKLGKEINRRLRKHGALRIH